MTTITDDFNRANASDLGANWGDIHGSGLQIVSNAASNSADGSYDGSGHNTALTADHYAQAVIAGKAAFSYFDVKGRWNGLTDASRDNWQSSVGGSNERYLTRVDDAMGTDVISNTVTFANGDTLRIECEGTTIRHIVGANSTSTTSSTYQTNTRVGLGIYRTTTVATFDNFEAGDIGGGTVALTGSALASSQGTVSPATSYALSGSALSAAQGTAAPSTSTALSGSALASAAGSLSPDLQIALTGQSLTFSQGTITASVGGDVSVELSGQILTASPGTLGPVADIALSGAELTAAQGALAPDASTGLSGQALTAAVGTVSPATAKALTGEVRTFEQGDVTPVVGITIELTGQALSLAQGALTADISSLLTGQPMIVAQGALGIVGAAEETFTGGFLYAYELEQTRRRRKRREQEELEEESRALKDQVDREIAVLLRAQESQEEREEELARLRQLVAQHSNERLEISDRARIAYVRALTQANFSALEALDRELQRQIEEEDAAVLMLLLNA